MTWNRGTLADFVGDCVVYRSLEPQDATLPGLGALWAAAGLDHPYIPRKATPEYARVVLRIIEAAQRARGVARPLQHIVFIGDTPIGDGVTARLMGEELPMLGFIGGERLAEAPRAEWQDGLLVANRWAALGDFCRELLARGGYCDETTALLIDLDKTSLGARGRNDRVIDGARVRAMLRTLRGALGEGVSEADFCAVYEPLNQPAHHAFTADNQDYVAYVSLMVTAGICPAEELWQGLASQSLRHIGQFADLCEARRGAMHTALRAAHDEVRHGLAVQDPTPYKGFRRAEFRETVAAMDVLPDDAPVAEVLAREIVITAEVASLAGHWAREGALVMGLSDKPDESSVPTPEDAARGLRPLHRTTMKIHGQPIC